MWCSAQKSTQEHKWQAAWMATHRQKPPPGEMVRLVARRLGGFFRLQIRWQARGAKAIWEGMEKIRHYAAGIEIGKAVYGT